MLPSGRSPFDCYDHIGVGAANCPPLALASHLVEAANQQSAARTAWMHPAQEPLEWLLEPAPLDFDSLYLDGQSIVTRYLVWQPLPCPGCCAIVTNQANRGASISNSAHMHASRTGANVVACEIRGLRSSPGGTVFVHATATTRRRVEAGPLGDADGIWAFDEVGTPLPFEETGRYGAASIRDRLPTAAVIRYMRAAGYPIDEPAFWTSQQEALLLRYKCLPAWLAERLRRDANS